MTYQLISETTYEPIPIPSDRLTFRGEKVRVMGFIPPQHPASSGRVRVVKDDGFEMYYFPSVIGAMIVERADR